MSDTPITDAVTERDVFQKADKESLKQKAAVAKDAVADLAGEVKHYAAARASDAKDTAAEWVQAGKKKVASASDCTVEYIERNPYQALAIAAGIGFVAGLILKRR